jgi:dienelactone hydrolase
LDTASEAVVFLSWRAPVPAQPKAVVAKILVLHGDDDPLGPFDQLTAFRNEMRSAEVNWEIDIYGGARHSFTGEGILDQEGPEAGLHPQSESRSWRKTVEFLAEVLT